MAPAGDGRSAAPAQPLTALLRAACLTSTSPVHTRLVCLSSGCCQTPAQVQDPCVSSGAWGQALCGHCLGAVLHLQRLHEQRSAILPVGDCQAQVPALPAGRGVRTYWQRDHEGHKANDRALHLAQAKRAAALQALERALRAVLGARLAAEQVVDLWTLALPLLGDKVAAVRQAALPVIGLLGAVATRPGARTGATPLCPGCASVLTCAFSQSWSEGCHGKECIYCLALCIPQCARHLE